MLKPKQQRLTRYWEKLSDDDLLKVDLTTDDPENLENLVQEIPPGDEETYVEFKYDLLGSGRIELVCVHGHHRHLKGFVMKKGKLRFLVGWMCGKSIYGEDFDQYTADFDTVINRQIAAKRKREIEAATGPFLIWMRSITDSEVFKRYRSVCDQMCEHMPWIFDNLPRAASMGRRPEEVLYPRTLFTQGNDPEREFARIAADFGAASLSLLNQNNEWAKVIEPTRRRMEGLLRRLEIVLDQLKEVEDFFQPAVLSRICDLANEYDNPKRRKYIAGLGSVTCRRDKTFVEVKMPKKFKLPDRRAIQTFRAALNHLGS